jgi:hypothetical protein
MAGRLLRKPVIWTLIGVLLAGAVFGLYWFTPWRLFTNSTADEALSVPVAQTSPVTTDSPAAPNRYAPAEPSSPPSAAAPAPAAPSPTKAAPTKPAPTKVAAPTVLKSGTFITHEHETTGTARIVRLANGNLQLELVGLTTSNGPDLRVWLSDQPVKPGRAGWFLADDGKWVELGKLRANRGNLTYPIPASVDISAYSSAVIWCKRFSVSFGAAAFAAP